MILTAGGTYDDTAGTITLPAGTASSTITADDIVGALLLGSS